MSEKEYLVFDIQKFSYHDGPGIRTSVFLKGCNLKCTWCQNPESQNKNPEIMYFKSNCIHCSTCIKTCPISAISIGEENQLKINRATCTLCGLCVKNCPTESLKISGKCMTKSEILDIVEEDRELYQLSGGGVTFTGGEPLAHDGIIELLEEAKRRELHIVIETAGNVSPQILREAAGLTDLFLYDIKFWDEQKHLEYCGCSNRRIIDNLRMLKKLDAKVQVRIPVIQTLNDSEEEITLIAKNIKEIGFGIPGLLLFNKFGTFKYDALDRLYTVKDIKLMDQQKLNYLKNIVADVFN